MSWETLELFQRSAKYFYRKYRHQGGTLDLLADQLNITATYLSAVINGSRIPSLNLQCRIASILHGPYDKFIQAGRLLEQGIEPHKEKTDEQENVDKLITRLTHLMSNDRNLTGKFESSEKKFMDISLTTGDMIFEVDQEFTFQFVAGKVHETTGLSADGALGKKLSDLVDESEWARIKPLLQISIFRKIIFDQILILANGEYRHCIAKPIYAEKKADFKGFQGTFRNITSRKKMEKTLDEKMWIFQSSIDAMDDSGLVITDKNNRVLRWNSAFEQFFDAPKKIRKKINLDELFTSIEEQAKNIVDFRKSADEAIDPPDECVQYFTLKDGRKIRRKTVTLYKDGAFAGRALFLRDVAHTPNTETI
jgi:PAS domain S-box-containing protein